MNIVGLILLEVVEVGAVVAFIVVVVAFVVLGTVVSGALDVVVLEEVVGALVF